MSEKRIKKEYSPEMKKLIKKLKGLGVIIIILAVIIGFSTYIDSLKSDISLPNNNSLLISENKSDVVYGDNIYKTASILGKYKANKNGFNIVGTSADNEKAYAILDMFEEIGLENTETISVPMSGWNLTDVSMTFECNCNDKGTMTFSSFGTYPGNFRFTSTPIEVIYIGSSTNIDKYDIQGRGVIVSDDENLEDLVNKVQNKGAKFLMYSQNREVISSSFVDLSFNFPTNFPIFVISNSNLGLIQQEFELGVDKLVTMNGSSTLIDEINGLFVKGEIVGKNKNKYITVMAYRDSISYGFQESNVTVAELIEIAKALKEENYIPKYTIRFIVGTGSKWGSILNSKYAGLRNYLEKYNPSNVKAVLLLDGNKSLSDVYLMQTAVTGSEKGLKNGISKFNNEYKKVHNEINTEIIETSVKELDARIWEEYKVPVVTAVEPFGSRYSAYKGSDCDSAALDINREVEQFKIPYYTALLKQLNLINY